MTQMVEDKKAQLLNRIQADFPLCKSPYVQLAQDLGFADEQEVFSLVQDLKREKIIRRLGAIFDSAHLGYASSLCALAVGKDKDFDEVAQLVNASSYVTHNYERPGHYNLWFTVTAPSVLHIHAFLEELAKASGCPDYLYLPALKLYKIRVDFKLASNESNDSNESSKHSPAEHKSATRPSAAPLVPSQVVVEEFSDFDKALVRLLQDDLSDEIEPYQAIAQKLTAEFETRLGHVITEDIVLQRLRNWKFNKTIRRFGAAVRHRKLGFSHNAMGVWNISDEHSDKVGAIMAQQPEISHCYERPRRETWPYNFYSMIHGMSEAECEAVAQRVVDACKKEGIEIKPEMLLYSTRELKKVSMRYFID